MLEISHWITFAREEYRTESLSQIGTEPPALRT